jgi:hypothetical protein
MPGNFKEANMSAQPANTSISVFRSLRTQRNILRHDSVAAITKRLRPLLLVKPGEENLVGVVNRDTAVSDFSPFMGQAAAGATRGFPIVVELLDTATFAQGQEITGADYAFQIGSDKFIKTSVAATDLFCLADAIN